MEAVLLTGGASTRMGADKAKLLFDGEPLGERIARLITAEGLRVTVLGREPLANYEFVRDEEEFAGPLVALSRFSPTSQLVFVVSCDVPGFDPSVIFELEQALGESDAAVSVASDKVQPLCALYRASAFVQARQLVEHDERRLMRWLDTLTTTRVEVGNPGIVANVNSPEELRDFLESRKSAEWQ